MNPIQSVDEIIQRLDAKIHKMNGELISLFCSGKAEEYANGDMMRYPAGTIAKLQDLCSKRNGLIDLLNDFKNDAGNKAQEEETDDADSAGMVEQSDSR